ncbi:unnamed protein product, partial [Coregonus sp. 'balchen']
MLVEHASLKGVRSHTVVDLILDQAVRWQLLLITFTTLQFCGINAVRIPTHQLRHVALGTGLCEISTSVACIQVSWMPYCSIVLIFTFFFSSGPAGVTAPLPGEIFNQSFKSAAFTIGCTLNWLGLLFHLIAKLDYFCFLSGLFVWYKVLETKNHTIMEITVEIQRMHPSRGSS